MKFVKDRPNIDSRVERRPAVATREECPQPNAFVNPKIHADHLARLAVIYIRQSSPHQVINNKESRERQYALVHRAVALGWARERVKVIDQDTARSGSTAEGRSGFNWLKAEIAMGHIGLLLGIEMSRVARNNKDWHELLELCANNDTPLADQDGLYDSNDSNDRLLLGLKGAMSEYELVSMRNRLQHSRLNKARRGEMFHSVPCGYILLPNGQPALDPDEQVQSVIHLIFTKFDELGSVGALFRYLLENNIRLPIRCQQGANKGQLEWRAPQWMKVYGTLRHPLYAGAYAYGRRGVRSNRGVGGAPRSTEQRGTEKWQVFLPDRWPGYISWNQFLENQQRLKQNRCVAESPGTPRQGIALLPGLLVCSKCNRRMKVHYRRKSQAQYACESYGADGRRTWCCGLPSGVIDDLVAQQVLRALEPASMELSLQSQSEVERERSRLHKHWAQDLKRVRHEAELAQRRYQAVDPANRFVAAKLEVSWETALRDQRQMEEEYDRFRQQTPRQLSAEERQQIVAAAADIRALWSAPSTTNVDRQSVVRCLVERAVVHVLANDEHFDVTIHWAGGYTSQHSLIRPVKTYAEMRDFGELVRRLEEMHRAGLTAGQIAKRLHADGFRPPRGTVFGADVVRRLLIRRGLHGKDGSPDRVLGEDEWWVPDLARHLDTTASKLMAWARRGWLTCRRTSVRRHWVAIADAEEVARLHELLEHSRRGVNSYLTVLTTPKGPSRRS